jgi:chromosomal replication initiator protein
MEMDIFFTKKDIFSLRLSRNHDIMEIVMIQNAEQWEKLLEVIEKNLKTRDFSTWIENRLSLVRCDKNAGVLYLGVDSDFHKAQLEYKYVSEIESAAAEVFGAPLRIRFLLPGEEASVKAPVVQVDDKEIIFNPRYTFDNFIIGDNSRFAAGAAQAVAQAPGKAYSPLFIYGGSGLGKTHLMNAIGIYILENFPKLNVLFVSSETFTEDFVNASIHKKMNDFKKKYRNVDVLLIDDIQFISEKEKTVEEVFNTYNTLYASGKQMVFTSDKPPGELLGIDERLKGRLAAGLPVDIMPPSYEIKVAILKKKAYLDGVVKEKEIIEGGLSEVISFIAENIKSNVRELESAFNRVVAYAKFVGVPFTKALAKQVLSDVVKGSGKGPSAKDIKKVVATFFNISVSAIDSDERTRSLSMPRQIAMYLCREIAGISFPKIAEVFKKDAATVQYGYNKIKKEIKQNDHLNNTVKELTEKIQSEY